MSLILSTVLGFVIDLIVGDPRGLVHPVQVIGWVIDALKKALQRCIYGCSWEEVKKRGLPRKIRAEKAAGFVLAIVIIAGAFFIMTGILALLQWIHPLLRFALESFFIYQIIATHSLKKESMKVYKKLKEGDLPGARKEIGYLEGRDTDELSESEVAKADVETIAENAADGVMAPLFFLALGGAALGFAYKAVNTLDSMVAYKNDELQYIGYASAKIDDVFNFIPSRLAAGMMLIASALLKMDAKRAWKVYRRDRMAHLSPNSAQTEAVTAGALGIRLGGAHKYFGKVVKKPTIGDDTRPVEYEDIRRTNRLLYATAILMVIVCCVITFLLVTFLGTPLRLA